MNNILIVFTILTSLNVIGSTIRSLLVIKGTKVSASLANACYYAFYTVVLIYTVAEFPLWQKIAITFVCNLIGVYIVKLIEEKLQKDKLWEVRMTVKSRFADKLAEDLNTLGIPQNYYITSDRQYAVFNIYCATQNESRLIKDFVEKYHAKYFVSESKIL